MGRQRYPKMTPEQERKLKRVARFQLAADGSYSWHVAGRTELTNAVATARAADCEVSVFVNGLTAETLADCAQTICDLAVEEGVSIRFRHRDRVMLLAVDPEVPGGAELGPRS